MRRRLPPPAPPPGFMWFYWELVPIETVERHARTRMGNHDRQPRAKRDRDNGDTFTGPARRFARKERPGPPKQGG
jgi:hypothetical protein